MSKDSSEQLLTMAVFRESKDPYERLMTMAVFGESDIMKNISPKIMTGVVGKREFCNVILDTEMIDKKFTELTTTTLPS